MTALEMAARIIAENGEFSEAEVRAVSIVRISELVDRLAEGPCPAVVELVAHLAVSEFHRLELEKVEPGITRAMHPLILMAMELAQVTSANTQMSAEKAGALH